MTHPHRTVALLFGAALLTLTLRCTTGQLPSDNFNFNENGSANENGAANDNQSGGNDNTPTGNANDNGGGNDNGSSNENASGNDNDPGNDNGGGNDNDPGNDNMDPGSTTLGWHYRSIWNAENIQTEVREVFWPDGSPREREEVRRAADGRYLKHGRTEKWFRGGGLSERTEFADGLPDGLMETWFETGEPRMRSHWAGGKLHGEMISWDRTDKVILRRQYEFGQVVKGDQ